MSTTNENTLQQAGELPDTVEGVLKSIADDIETRGHYQSEISGLLWDATVRADGKCCLLVNPTRAALREAGRYTLMCDSDEEIKKRVYDQTHIRYLGVAAFSDMTPTDQVLEMLRADA